MDPCAICRVPSMGLAQTPLGPPVGPTGVPRRTRREPLPSVLLITQDTPGGPSHWQWTYLPPTSRPGTQSTAAKSPAEGQ